MWELIYSKNASDFLEKLDATVAHAIYSKLSQTKENPYRFFSRMVSVSTYRLRVGYYRIIADLQERVKIVAVIKVGHRKNVYER